MQEPLEIVFHNLQPSAALEADIRQRFEKLAKLYDRLTTCRVSVEGLHKQHRTGNIFEVHIDMLVPGGEIVVSKQPQKAKERFANPDVYTSVREAFKAAERQLLEYKRQLSGEVKQHGPMFQGQVAEMHVEEEYGYILTAEGSLLYFHRNAMLNGDFEKLQRGSLVHYTPGDGETGPTAVKVWQGSEGELSRA
jgi:ribosome-associated translation inhibitor RaiA